MLRIIKSRVERLESAIRKEVNDMVRPVMANYQISNVVFMEQTVLFDKFAEYYKTDVESLAKYMDTNAPFQELGDSWWTRWMDTSDSDLVSYVRRQQATYTAATQRELYGDKDNVQLLIRIIYLPVKVSIERAITATQYLISADM